MKTYIFNLAYPPEFLDISINLLTTLTLYITIFRFKMRLVQMFF